MSDITVAWRRRTLTCTGPATFHLAVPITGPAPHARAANALVSDLQKHCQGTAAAHGTTVRAVRGSITTTTRGAHLVMYITVSHPSSEPHRDAAYVDAAIQRAARRATAPALITDTSPVPRMAHADHCNPNDPPPRAPWASGSGQQGHRSFAAASYDQQRQQRSDRHQTPANGAG